MGPVGLETRRMFEEQVSWEDDDRNFWVRMFPGLFREYTEYYVPADLRSAYIFYRLVSRVFSLFFSPF